MEKDATENHQADKVCAKKAVYGLIAAIVLLYAGKAAVGVVFHPTGEPNLAVWKDRPDSNVVGAWGNNASFVVIAPNWVVTTRHQGDNDSLASVTINGIIYNCHYSPEWKGGPAGDADIRLVRLTKTDGNDANLFHYAEPYKDSNEVGKEIVIGGYGNGRGANLVKNDKVYGYQWDGSGNTTRRWGQNRVDNTGVATETYTSDVIFADFDGLSDDNPTTYECIVADHDSGGGWFIYDGNVWKVAGLPRGVEHGGECWFRNNMFPTSPDPDLMDAVRISSYAAWISGIIYPPGDLTGDEGVDFADFAILAQYWQHTDCHLPDWCAGADHEPDGDVDWADLNVIVEGWLGN